MTVKKNFLYSKSFPAIATTIVLCIITVAVAYIYTALSKTVYFWDDATYWDICRSITGGELKGRFWSGVYNSVGTMDYNYVAALPSSLWMLIFGESRVAYVTGLAVMYACPAIWLVRSLAKKLAADKAAMTVIPFLAMPIIIFSICSGFVDVGGVMIALICLNLYFTRDGITTDIRRFAVIGALLVLIMVFRRYYAFFAVSFIIAAAAECAVSRRGGKGILNILIMCAVAGAILLIFFRTFLTDILLKNYGSLYSSYKYGIITDIKLITRYYGLIFILLIAIGSVIGARKCCDERPIMLWIQILVCALLFMSTQTHGQQHLLLYFPSLTALVLITAYDMKSMKFSLILLVLAVVNIANTFVPRTQPQNIRDIKRIAMIPNFSMLPVKDENVGVVLALKEALDAEIPEGAVCAIGASSFKLNESVLTNVEPSLGISSYRSSDYIISIPEVDSRDMSRLNEIYAADYILEAFPAQTHLAEGEQRIVTELAASFAVYADVAMSFEEVEGFQYNIGDIQCKLYRRVSDIEEWQINEFEARLQ